MTRKKGDSLALRKCAGKKVKKREGRKRERSRKKERSRERLFKRSCFAFACDLLPQGWELDGGAGLGGLTRQPDRPQGTPEPGVLGVAQYLVHRHEFTGQQAHLYTSVSIEHIANSDKPFGLAPIMTIHPLISSSYSVDDSIVLDRFTGFFSSRLFCLFVFKYSVLFFL